MITSKRLPTQMLVVCLLGLLLAWGAVPVSAATLTATNEATLITAVTTAVAGDTIEISAGITIQLTANLPNISANGVTINGNGATIKGGSDIRIFTIASGANVTINNLTMQNGNCNGSCPQVTTDFFDGFAGGILTYGTVTISDSTLSGNSSSAYGGAISNNGTLTITNSTFSGNSAYIGGGISNVGALTITNSTLSGNSATSYAGGGLYNNGGVVTLKNTLLGKGATGTNCSGTIASNGAAYNLSDDGSCGADVTQVASLSLGTLGANGGSTDTIPLLAGSAAIDAALAADCPATDQRGSAASWCGLRHRRV